MADTTALLARIAELENALAEAQADARRFRALTGLLQAAYDGPDFESEDNQLTVRCRMLSGFRGTQLVEAQLFWQDSREEPLDLGRALDAVGATLPGAPR